MKQASVVLGVLGDAVYLAECQARSSPCRLVVVLTRVASIHNVNSTTMATNQEHSEH